MELPCMRERSIIHLNVTDFAVAVECVVQPRLCGRPVIVAPVGAARARVMDMSEEAFRAGVRKEMPVQTAQRLLRDVLIVPPNIDLYARAARALLRQALPYTPQVEQVDGNGHLYLDVTGTSRLWGPPRDVAWRIRRDTRADLRLDPIWAVAANKLVAKVATRIVKPDGELTVAAGDEASRGLWGPDGV